MYAIIETGGKQYMVRKDDIIYVEKLEAEDNSTVDFKVIAGNDGKGLKVGKPYLDSAKVEGNVLSTKKGKKITVLTYKPKKSVKRKLGHRQMYTKVQINSISL